MTAEILQLNCDEADDLAGLYVLGALEGADQAAVRNHLATCVHPHPLFAELGGTLPALQITIEPMEPPANLRTRVLAAVAAAPQVPVAETAAVAPAAVVPARMAEPISLAAERERRASGLGRSWRTALSAAAVLLIVVLGATSVAFQRQASDAEQRANTLSAAIAASLDPSSAVASLRGSGVAASAAGFAAFPKSGTGYLVIHGLPQVPSDKTYEAWFLAGKTPYPSVLITPTADGLVVISGLTATQGADAMALTIEPAGGGQTPTGDVVVIGKMQQGTAASAIVGTWGASLH